MWYLWIAIGPVNGKDSEEIMPRRKRPKLTRREKLLATLVALQSDMDARHLWTHKCERKPTKPEFVTKQFVIPQLGKKFHRGEVGLITYEFLAELVGELSSESNDCGTG